MAAVVTGIPRAGLRPSVSAHVLGLHQFLGSQKLQHGVAFYSCSTLSSAEPVASTSTASPAGLAGTVFQASAQSKSRFRDVLQSDAGQRKLKIQNKLASIEATRGTVSQYLRDSFARDHDYLRISLTEKCNLRCTYCMPEEGAPLSPKEHLLTSDEVIKLASVFVRNGVRKVRLTGGEPTIRRDLVEIVERLSALGLESIGMTSNGIVLSRKLPDLVQAGLTHLNISLDTLDPFKFEVMTRRRGHSTVLKAMRQATDLLVHDMPGGRRLKSVKLNVVVINKLNSDEVLSFVELTKELPISVRFIEYMPFDGNKWSTVKLVPSHALLSRIKAGFPQGSIQAITPEPSDTARTYRRDGYVGSFGFISSMTDHFCSGCSRLRLGADGSMKVCLFGEPTLSLRDLLRSGASDLQLSEAIGVAVKGKKFAHDGKAVNRLENATLRNINLRPGNIRLLRPSFRSMMARGSLDALGQRSMPNTERARTAFTWSRPRQDETSPRLTHISNQTGKPSMVSVTGKASTVRTATAVGRIVINKVAYDLLDDNLSSRNPTGKGDVLTVAQLAGIMGSKKTADLIPLCHPLNLSNVQVQLNLGHSADRTRHMILVSATAECMGATGVEMEALTAVSVACLTVWDMLKAVAGKEMIIEDIKVIEKSGGKSGSWRRDI